VKASRPRGCRRISLQTTRSRSRGGGEALNTASTKYAKEAHRFDGLQLSRAGGKRLLLELAAGFPAPDDPKAQKELAQIRHRWTGTMEKEVVSSGEKKSAWT